MFFNGKHMIIVTVRRKFAYKISLIYIDVYQAEALFFYQDVPDVAAVKSAAAVGFFGIGDVITLTRYRCKLRKAAHNLQRATYQRGGYALTPVLRKHL